MGRKRNPAIRQSAKPLRKGLEARRSTLSPGGESRIEEGPVPPGGLRAFRWSWTAFMVLATSVPYLLSFFFTPEGYHFTWALPPYPEDSLAYMAWSQQAAHGSLLFHIKYTAIPHDAFLFNPFFLICGWISHLSGCEVGVVHWMMKAVGVACFFGVLFRYTDYLGLNRFQSVAASVLVGISSGLGGLLAFINPLVKLAQKMSLIPTDVWLVDSNTFWSLLWNPLFPYSLALLLLAIYWLDRGTRDGRKGDFWFSGLATGGLALIHPYSQPLLFSMAVAATLARRRTEVWGCLGRYFCPVIPFALYVVLVAKLHPLVARHNAQGSMPSPHILAYILGFGLPLFLLIGGLAVGWGRWVKRYWQILLWFLLSLAFCYLPFWFQRKFIFGAHVPLCILAAIASDLLLARWCAPRVRRKAAIAVSVLLLPLLVSTQVYLAVIYTKDLRDNAERGFYFSDGFRQGLDYLKRNTKPDEVVFASVSSSRLIPAFSGNTVVWGHWAMSVDYEERKAWFKELFNHASTWDDEERFRVFWGDDIHYLFADGAIKEAIEKYPQAWRVILKGAEKVFANDSVLIYRRPNR